MHRTMIYIEDTDHQLLQKKARACGKRLSELVREAVRFYLEKVVKRPSWDADPLWNLAGSAKAKEPNTDSIDHDKILYGKNR